MSDFLLPDRKPDITLRGEFTTGQDATLEHIPFDIPDGVDQFLIDITYNDRIGSSPMERGGNTLDVG
ncbi:MAG: hypothetical protein M3412_02365, partial [Chloroflexota bacterium]|nr:hypothetical protein [Chloroflexota bacterium]